MSYEVRWTAEALGSRVEVECLEIIEILDWYDGPMITLSKVDGVLHYSHAVDTGNGWAVYIYVPVGEGVAEQIRHNQIALRDVLTAPEQALVITFDWNGLPNRRIVRSVSTADLPPEWLPQPGACLAP